MLSRPEHLAALRAEVQKIEGRSGGARGPALPLGVAEVDARLAGGGLAGAALHEVAARSPSFGDDAAATLFLAALAARKARADEAEQGGVATILWALARRDLFAPGLAGAGLGPDRLLYAECRDDAEVLAVMEEGLRHGGLAAVVAEVGRCAMAAGRRLQLAAEEGGTLALMMRRWRRAERDPLAEPSPAVTRWRVGCAPSAPLPHAGIGRARWHVDLARQRGGEPFTCILEAPDAEARLALSSLSPDRADQARAA
jgi:protein ImuA